MRTIRYLRTSPRAVSSLCVTAAALVIALTGCTLGSKRGAGKTYQREATKADVDGWIESLSNWGRWGKDDRIGALHLIDAGVRRRAAALVTEGVSVSMAHNVEKDVTPDNPKPFRHTMKLGSADWAVDEYCVDYHGYAHTHMDALCHIFHDGKTYNGYPRGSVTEAGAQMLGIEQVKDKTVGRGVLLDVARAKRVAPRFARRRAPRSRRRGSSGTPECRPVHTHTPVRNLLRWHLFYLWIGSRSPWGS